MQTVVLVKSWLWKQWKLGFLFWGHLVAWKAMPLSTVSLSLNACSKQAASIKDIFIGMGKEGGFNLQMCLHSHLQFIPVGYGTWDMSCKAGFFQSFIFWYDVAYLSQKMYRTKSKHPMDYFMDLIDKIEIRETFHAWCKNLHYYECPVKCKEIQRKRLTSQGIVTAGLHTTNAKL